MYDDSCLAKNTTLERAQNDSFIAGGRDERCPHYFYCTSLFCMSVAVMVFIPVI
jgi:hypothetical protein